MRVIAGEFRSRRLKSVPGSETRPTPDRLREALFNVLAPRLDGCTFVDAYAGTGAVGIEALSRGASRAIFLEKSRAALAVIRDNLAALDLTAKAEIAAGSAPLLLTRYSGDIIFLDPPYSREKEYGVCLELLGRTPPPLVVAQHDSRLALADQFGRLRKTRVLRQGDNALSFYEPADVAGSLQQSESLSPP